MRATASNPVLGALPDTVRERELVERQEDQLQRRDEVAVDAVFADMMSKANVSHAAEAGRPSGASLCGPRRGLRYWLGVVQAWARGHLSPLAQRSGLPRTSSMRDRTRATREPHLSAQFLQGGDDPHHHGPSTRDL